MELSNRVALITGGKRIGSTVAIELARRGADIALTYNRSSAEAEATANAAIALGRRAIAVRADLTKPADCRTAVETVASELGRLDILVNMASIYAAKPYEDLTETDWDASMNVDARAAFLCTRAAVPFMRAQGGGRIINFADWLPFSHRPRYKGFLPYYVAKGTVVALTEALALELAEDGILVNAIAPGPILAPPDLSEDEHEAVEKATPVGRWGGGLEIAKAIVGLIDTDFITGEIIRVDGGRHLK